MKKFLIALLALMMLAMPLLTACGGEDEESSAGVSTGTSDTVSKEEEAKFPLEEKKYDTTVTILTRRLRFSQQFMPNEEYEGSVINSAVEARNQLIEEKYGITIALVEDNRPATAIETSITANTADYDIVCDAVNFMIPHVTDN